MKSCHFYRIAQCSTKNSIWHYHHFPRLLLFSMTFQAWKMVFLNSMTFHDQGGTLEIVWSCKPQKNNLNIGARNTQMSRIWIGTFSRWSTQCIPPDVIINPGYTYSTYIDTLSYHSNNNHLTMCMLHTYSSLQKDAKETVLQIFL